MKKNPDFYGLIHRKLKKLTLATVSQVIDEIETNTKFKFLFKTDVVDLKRKVSINVTESGIYNILALLFDNTRTDYLVRNRKILLRKRKKAFTPPINIKQDGHSVILPKIEETVKVPERIVTGTIRDANTDESLIGANVVEKGTSNGTITDFDGNFSLDLKGDNPILVISYTGFKSIEITVGDQTTFEITLKEDATELGEIVVVGYGSVVKKDVTGAVATIKPEAFNTGEISSPEQLFQGKTPGVQIPLYVVNGVPLSGSAISPAGANVGGNDQGAGNTTPKNPLAFLNPKDIERRRGVNLQYFCKFEYDYS